MNKWRNLPLSERLVVAADYTADPEGGRGRGWAYNKILGLASLIGQKGIIKVNSVLRGCGYGLIDRLHSMGLKVFDDEKLVDGSQTLENDAALLRESLPEILTVSIPGTSPWSLDKLRKSLPDTELLGVTVQTDFDDKTSVRYYGTPVNRAVHRFAQVALEAGFDGVVCAPTEARMLREVLGEDFSINTPNTRPGGSGAFDAGQNPIRQMTPGEAIKAGTTRVIIGQPITQMLRPRISYENILAEIEEALTSIEP
jgi:orotidine-5'-phosphate decarboxylase